LALYNYMSQILVELVKTADLIISMIKSAACASRVASVLEISPAQIDGNEMLDIFDEIEFKNVSFKYYEDGDEAVSKINFKAKKGQVVGIVGGTGSGKSTVVNLIPRFYDSTQGQVLLNGKDIKDYTFSSLRDKISVVPQKSNLFSGTIRDNIKWGKTDASDEEIFRALDIAQASELLKEKNGLDTIVSQSGKNFSGGQKQRLSIARAIVKNPDILILDDSSSALDYITDLKLRQAIGNIENPPLCFIVSQRVSSVKNADLILVLDDGETVGQGKHKELFKTCESYREKYHAQFKEV
ncbi:MAG: ABC transporter ATP-binding protein, partial [Clostridia bacterium]